MSKIEIKTGQPRPERKPVAPADRLYSFRDVISDENDTRTFQNVPVRLANPIRSPGIHTFPDVEVLNNTAPEPVQGPPQENTDEGQG